MKHVVSVSLGTSKRNKRDELEILGEPFVLERIGTDGDMQKFAEMFRDLDGKVDALGVGGADIWLVSATSHPIQNQKSEIRNHVRFPVQLLERVEVIPLGKVFRSLST